MLISPTDRELHQLGEVSSLPERWGCDVLIRTKQLWVGVQRKEIKDLIASVQDGRLSKEVMQMSACGRLDTKVLLIEGVPKWTSDHVLMTNGFGAQWTLAQHRGLLWSVRQAGIWVDHTASVSETRTWLKMFEQWCGKDKHQSLARRPAAQGAWGKPDSAEFIRHCYMSLPGVGPELAQRIQEMWGMAWTWTITEEQLMQVPGVGKKKAHDMITSLCPSLPASQSETAS